MARDPVRRFGGIKALQRRLRGRSKVISQNKDAIAAELVSMAMVNLTDIIEWDEKGSVTVKASAEITDEATRAIKRFKITNGKDGPILEIELHDKVRVLQILAKAAGLLEPVMDMPNTPSVVGITMKGPEIIEVEVEEIRNDDTQG